MGHVAVLLSLMLSTTIQADPITGFVGETPSCDPVTDILSAELGLPIPLGGPFTPTQGITFSAIPASTFMCVADDGLANDWAVTITNISGAPWGAPVSRPLYFVANFGNSVGNADGVSDFTLFPGASDAFLIDSSGVNPNLIVESAAADGLFAPGESWVFLVTNFITPAALGSSPSFMSFGHSILGPPPGTASIVVGQQVIPEPSSLIMVGLVALGMLGYRIFYR